MDIKTLEEVLAEFGFLFAYQWGDTGSGYKKGTWCILVNPNYEIIICDTSAGYTEETVMDIVRFQGIIDSEELLKQTLNSILNDGTLSEPT